jgi:hypothetical protein
VFSLLQKYLRFKPLLDITKNTIAVGLWGGQAAFWILSWHYAINQPFFFSNLEIQKLLKENEFYS